jgi:2-iminobutanoate/2-iminopropanoate deaminase
MVTWMDLPVVLGYAFFCTAPWEGAGLAARPWGPCSIIAIMTLRNFCMILTLAAALSPAAPAQKKKVIQTPNTAPGRPFSSALMVGNTLYVSGMVGRTPDGKIPESFEAEVKQTLDNILEVVKVAGMSFADAVAVQVYLTDMTLFDRMNKVYMEAFPEPRPTRTTVGVSKLVGTSRIEITVTLVKGAGGK